MSTPSEAAASDSGNPDIPTFADLAADPEIAPLLNFEPVVRQIKRPNGWTPELQKELIARLAATGTLQHAVWQMGKHATGAEGLYKVASAATFRASWDAAIIIGRRRNRLDAGPPHTGSVPGITRRGVAAGPVAPLPGQVLNELGEWEDQDSLNRRAEEARDSIARKLLNARRLYLWEISASPGKRAAFEILTELPIDWAKAAGMEPQDDEPWRKPNMRKADMVLTAENGWFGEVGYGEDKKAELRRAVDEERASRGLPPARWDADDGDERESAESESTERSDAGACAAGAARRDAEPDRPGFGREATDSFDVTDSLRDVRPPSEASTPRTLHLNSPEFHKVVTEPRPDAWRGDLPRPPREWDAEPVVKVGPAPRKGKK